jgi:hypothetical protein
MLKLVDTSQDQPRSIKFRAIDESQSHLFIDELIARIKYLHLEEIWAAELDSLFRLASPNSKKAHLRAL